MRTSAIWFACHKANWYSRATFWNYSEFERIQDSSKRSIMGFVMNHNEMSWCRKCTMTHVVEMLHLWIYYQLMHFSFAMFYIVWQVTIRMNYFLTGSGIQWWNVASSLRHSWQSIPTSWRSFICWNRYHSSIFHDRIFWRRRHDRTDNSQRHQNTSKVMNSNKSWVDSHLEDVRGSRQIQPYLSGNFKVVFKKNQSFQFNVIFSLHILINVGEMYLHLEDSW
jgi:hypothetical protein